VSVVPFPVRDSVSFRLTVQEAALSDEEPKTAYELILERLKQKDRAEGKSERPVSAKQKAKIAELRKVYEAKLAEREILHQADRRKAADPEALERLDEDYRRDRERTMSERDRKIDEVRNG
jgi:hypothetical protein